MSVVEKVKEGAMVKKWFVESEKTEYALRVEFDDRGLVDEVEIRQTYYPIHPYSNYVSNVLKIKYVGGELPYEIEVYTVRMSWGGTGSDKVLKLRFNDYSGETPAFLRGDVILSIKNVEDLKEYIKDVGSWLKDLIDTTVLRR